MTARTPSYFRLEGSTATDRQCAGTGAHGSEAVELEVGTAAPAFLTSKCFLSSVQGHRQTMTDRIEGDEIEVEVELEEDADEEQVDRAPQPGNTPAPGDPPIDSGAITGGRLADDH